MNNILKLSTIAILTFVANSSQATELVKVQATSAFDFLEIAKVNLAQSIKLNTIEINTIEIEAHAQIAMAQTKAEKRNDESVKTTSLAE
jgi:hypothetical protein